MRKNEISPDSRAAGPGTRVAGWAAAWVGWVCRRPLAVTFCCLAAAAGLLWFAAATLAINTSTEDMLSEELPWRQNNRAVDHAFPDREDALTIAVEGPDAVAAEQGAARLAAALEARPETFQSVYLPEGGAFFRRNGLLFLSLDELQQTGDRLAEAQPLLTALQRDPSLRGLAGLLSEALSQQDAGADLAALAPLLTEMAETAEALKTDPTARVAWQALVSGTAETAQDRRRVVIAKPVIDFATLQPLAAAVTAVEAAARDLGLTGDNGYRLRLTGEALMLQDELISVRTGIGIVGLISAILVAVVLFAGLKSWRLVVPVLITLVAGLAWTAGFAAFAVGALNLISVAFAVLFIGLSVDFGIHYALRVQESRGAGLATAAALPDAAGRLGRPLLLCALSSALAFFAFFPTAYQGLSELGLIAGTGMFIALFLNLTLLPALLRLWAGPAAPAPAGVFARAGAAVERRATAWARPLAGLGLLLALAAAFALPEARFDDDPLNLRDPDSPSVAALLDLLDDPRVSPYSAEVLLPAGGDAAGTAARLEALPEVEAALTLEDFVPTEQAAKLEIVDQTALLLSPLFTAPPPEPAPDDEERAAALADLRAALADPPPALEAEARQLAAALADLGGVSPRALEQAWLGGFMPLLDRLLDALEVQQEVTLADLPAELRRRFEAPDGSRLIVVKPARDLRDPPTRERFVAAVRTVAPRASGVPVTIVEAGSAVVTAFAQASVLALVAIALLLLAVLRSPRDSVLVLLPLLLAALLTVAAGVLLDLPFNFANVIVLPLLLGLGVDSGIHYVMRAREQAGGAAGEAAVGEAAAGEAPVRTNTTPRAIFLSATTTLASFGALSLSAHPGTASMGQLLTLAITLTLVSVLVFLPALLALAGRMPRA